MVYLKSLLKIVFVFVVSLLSLVEISAQERKYDYMVVHPCRVKVNDTLCYLIREGGLYDDEQKWTVFRGEISNYYFEEGYLGVLAVDKYDPQADTIYVCFQSYICNTEFQYEKKGNCDCEKFRKHYECGDLLYKSSLAIWNKLGVDDYGYALAHPNWKGLEYINKKREKQGINKKLVNAPAETMVSGKADGCDYVDLGLPSGRCWATCNVGATEPTEVGDAFQWGVTRPKKKYMMGRDDWNTYKWSKIHNGMLKKYCLENCTCGKVDNKATLEAEDDAATACWGPRWRMPTRADAIELRRGCTWELCDDFNGTGVSGIVGTSIYNGNKIFLPQLHAFYWTSTLVFNNSYNAYIFKVFEDLGIASNVGRGKKRTYAFYVRAVVK